MGQMLTDLGDLLAARGLRYHLAVIGGTALLLRAVVDRTTRDVDAIGMLEDGEWVPLDELPPDLAGAVEDVALLHGESKDWLNARPRDLLRIGMPRGWEERLSHSTFGGALEISVIGRIDLIHTKLYALTDSGPLSKHAADLLALSPSAAELRDASTWCRQHDTSPTFADQLEEAVAWLHSQLS